MYEHGPYKIKATLTENEAYNVLAKATMQEMIYGYLQEAVDQVNDALKN